MLSIEHLNFAYGKKEPLVLRDFSLELPEGKIGILLGPNGSGKSTLFKVLVGIEKPQSGSVRFAGKDLLAMKRGERARALAYVPQSILFGDLSVFDSVMAGRLSHFGFYPSAEDEAVVSAILAEMGLTSLALRPTRSLSGGERQKVAIARALAQQPSLLLFDEPTGNLDINNEQLILKEAKRIVESRSISVLLSIHDLSLAADFGDVFYLMKDGGIAYSGEGGVLNETTLSDIYGIKVSVETLKNKKFIYIGGNDDEKD